MGAAETPIRGFDSRWRYHESAIFKGFLRAQPSKRVNSGLCVRNSLLPGATSKLAEHELRFRAAVIRSSRALRCEPLRLELVVDELESVWPDAYSAAERVIDGHDHENEQRHQ
jgi:hypothetical protein